MLHSFKIDSNVFPVVDTRKTAIAFLALLSDAGMLFHPDDDTGDISAFARFSPAERDDLRMNMTACFEYLPSDDVYAFCTMFNNDDSLAPDAINPDAINSARSALSRAVNDAIANGAPIYTEQRFVDPATALRRIARNYQTAREDMAQAEKRGERAGAAAHTARSDTIVQTWAELRDLTWLAAFEEILQAVKDDAQAQAARLPC